MTTGAEPQFVLTGRLEPVEISRLCSEAEAAGVCCWRVELAGCVDRSDFLERVARPLAFPDWFGFNWDALFDCLADLSWQPAEAYLLILENADDFQREAPEAFAVATTILADAASVWQKRGVEFRVLIDAGTTTGG
jgi:RNAse (barnase) inhibitor barstar